MLRRVFGRFFGAEEAQTKDDTTVQTQSDAKQKWAEERDALMKQLADTNKRHESEIAKLQEQLKKDKSGSKDNSTQQISKREAELSKEWQEKCDRLVNDSNAKHQRTLSELQTTNRQLEEKVKEMEDKYDNIRTQASAMKGKYEAKIVEMQGSSNTQGGKDQGELLSEVKKIMSSVYHALKQEFEDKSSYNGAEINETIMDTIKSVTIQMMQTQANDDQGASKSDSDEDVKPVVAKEARPMTGGQGNPYRAAELEQKEKAGDIFVSEAAPTSGEIPKSDPAEISKKEKSTPDKEVTTKTDKPEQAVSVDKPKTSTEPSKTDTSPQKTEAKITDKSTDPKLTTKEAAKTDGKETKKPEKTDKQDSKQKDKPSSAAEAKASPTKDASSKTESSPAAKAPASTESSPGKSSASPKEDESKKAQSPEETKAKVTDSTKTETKVPVPQSKQQAETAKSGSGALFGSPESDDSGELFKTSPSKDSKKEAQKDASQTKPTTSPSKDAAKPKIYNSDSDDGLKPKPPPAPLFGDDDDDDDWLSK